MKVQLIVVKGKPEGKVIPLTGPSFKVGRGEGCHLRPNSELVSREHTEVILTDDRVSVRDLGSRNGTLVNGKTITQERVLKNGDLLQVGPLTFAVDIQGAPAPAPARAEAPVARKKAKPASLDDVSNAEIEAWLVADDANTPPERPSGVYTGDTQTFTAYKEETDKAKVTKKPVAAKPGAKPAPSPKPAAPEPEAEPEFDADFNPFAEGPEEIETKKPAKPGAKPAPPPQAAKPKSKPEPEPEPEAEPEFDADFNPFAEGPEEIETAETVADQAKAVPEELVDESNPFHAKKKPEAAEPPKSTKPNFSDSSSAANDILKRMMERRKSSK
jgi:predicted component of type VI protein secretion system